MKRFAFDPKWAAVLLALSVLLLAGCHKDSDAKKGDSAGGSGGSGSSSTSGGSTDDPNTINGTGDKDAVQAVRAELASHWLHTPDGWFSEFPSKTYIATGQRAGPESFYRQFKELKFEIEAGELSDSDKLNGVQFRGDCLFNSPPVRLYNDPNAFGPPAWSAWHPSIESLTVEMKNGQWHVGSNGYLLAGTQPKASTIAQLK